MANYVKKEKVITEPEQGTNEVYTTSENVTYVPEKSKEEMIINHLKEAKELCTQCAAERRAVGLSMTRVANVGRMLNEHIKVLTPLLNDY
ncbi:MAG: hypothetical protein WCX48_08455 [Bacteroidales bacterium]